jgi:hypothetical protein
MVYYLEKEHGINAYLFQEDASLIDHIEFMVLALSSQCRCAEIIFSV